MMAQLKRQGCLILLLFLLDVNVTYAETLSAAVHGHRPESADPATQEFSGPIQLFDNLYYIGTTFVSAYLLVTEEGLILIDTLYGDFSAQAMDSIIALGYSAQDIRYILITHGHNDHVGGAEYFATASGSAIAMSREDWQLTDLTPDVIINDGDALALGNTQLKFYLTPGHTKGVLSIEFMVMDGTNAHKAFLFGGHNVTSGRKEDYATFIDSVRRLQAQLDNVEVNLTSHPWASLIFQRAELLATRQAAEPHPFVDAEDFRAFLEERLDDAIHRLGLLQ